MESCFSNVNGCNSCQLVAATASLRYDDYFTPFLPTNRSCEPAVLGAICPDADNGRCCVLANEAFDLYNPYRHLCSKPYAVNDTQSQHFSPNDRKVALAGTLGFKQQLGIGSNFTLETSWHVGQTTTVTLRDNANGTVGSFELNSTSNKATWRDATTSSSVVVTSLAILTASVQRIQFRVTSSSLQVSVNGWIVPKYARPVVPISALSVRSDNEAMCVRAVDARFAPLGVDDQASNHSDWQCLTAADFLTSSTCFVAHIEIFTVPLIQPMSIQVNLLDQDHRGLLMNPSSAVVVLTSFTPSTSFDVVLNPQLYDSTDTPIALLQMNCIAWLASNVFEIHVRVNDMPAPQVFYPLTSFRPVDDNSTTLSQPPSWTFLPVLQDGTMPRSIHGIAHGMLLK
ncbi:hypothetical protein AaE_006642 [Aphanomyces astaci]|uniref:Uncharacterized protein n=1 Tax=Aphanomyces astaci TaxID=112090 RepID=A0A6A5AGI3_APHAT|nr:hypothetical protein AaE_006642 [Aphanomyces astaci]